MVGSRGMRFGTGLLLGFGLLAFASGHARAGTTQWNTLTTGNGHGFQQFDANKNRIVSFQDHPYRYVGPPSPAGSHGDGPTRRNLVFDVFFGAKGGGWLSEATPAKEPAYVDETNIIYAPVTAGGKAAESYYFAPFGYEGNALIGLMKAPGASDGYALFNFHLGGGAPDKPDASGEASRAAGTDGVIEVGPGGGAMVYVALSGADHIDCNAIYAKGKAGTDFGNAPACNGNDVVPGFQKKLGADGWMAIAMQYVENPADADAAAASLRAWGKQRSPEQILNDAKAEFEAWRKPPAANVALCADNEKKLWRQSETVLRMGQIREPNFGTRNNNGMILASLPPGRWDSAWVRDGTYATVALARMGHLAEAKASLNFFLNATPVSKYKSYVSNQDYRISVVRYYGNGEEEADYTGQTSPNVEIDGWGLVLWAARQYVDASGDVAWLKSPTRQGSVYEALQGGVAKPLEANLEPQGFAKADSSIWEVHDQNKRHYAYTSMAVARGFCDMAQIALKGGDTANVKKYQDLALKVRTAFLATFVNDKGALIGSLEGPSTHKYDGAVAEAFDWNLLADFKGDMAKSTIEALSNLRVDSGGFKRNDDAKDSYDNNEWILVDFRIANALRRNGKSMESDSFIGQIVDKASTHSFLLPELYNSVATDGAVGVYAGETPMVGYGGGAFVMTMLDRSGIIEPNDCADGQGKTLEVLKCDGIVTGPGATGTGPGGTGPGATSGPGGTGGPGATNGAPDATQVPYTAACLCNLSAGPGRAPWAFAVIALPWILAARRWSRRRRP